MHTQNDSFQNFKFSNVKAWSKLWTLQMEQKLTPCILLPVLVNLHYQSAMTSKWQINLRVSTLCPKKVVHQTHGDNFVNSQRIFKILSLLESQVNF